MAGNDDTYQREFYAPWPDLGKKLSQQWNEIRNNMSALAPVVRGVGLDSDGDYSDLNGLEKMSMQAIEVGKQDFHNKYRFHYNKTDDLLEMAYNDGTTVIPHWYTTWTINADGHVSQQNTPTTASNLGTGEGVFFQKSGVDLEFKSLKITSPLAISSTNSDITISGSALVSTYSSDRPAAPSGDANTGVEIILSDTGKVGNDLPFKALKAGPNVVIRNLLGTAIEIESTAQVVEFYGISVSATDSNPAYIEVHNLLFNREDFYITQQKTTPSNKTVIVNSISDPFNSTDYVAVIGDDMTGQLAMHDGTAAEPAIGFTSETTTGIRLRAVNDLALTVAGSDKLRAQANQILAAVPLELTSTADATTPDLAFFPNTGTGLYQIGTSDDSLAFATAGTYAGKFDSSQLFHISSSMQAGNGTLAAPSYSFTNQTNSGIYKANDSATLHSVDIAANEKLVASFRWNTSDVLSFNPQGQVRANAAVGGSTAPQYSWDSYTGLGMYYSLQGSINAIAFATSAHAEHLLINSSTNYIIMNGPGLIVQGSGGGVAWAKGSSPSWVWQQTGGGHSANYWTSTLNSSNNWSLSPYTPNDSLTASVDALVRLYPSLTSIADTKSYILCGVNSSGYDFAAGSTSASLTGFIFKPNMNQSQTGTINIRGYEYTPQINGIAASVSVPNVIGFLSAAFPVVASAGKVVVPPVSFQASPTMKSQAAAAAWTDATTYYPKSYLSSPYFTTASAGTISYALAEGFTSYANFTNNGNAGGSVTVTAYNDIRIKPIVKGGVGTETLTTRTYINMDDETATTNLYGITSAITSGANKKFINHTGDAASLHTGDFVVTDDAYAASWDGNYAVPTKNALYDKIETIVAEAADGYFYGAVVKQVDYSSGDIASFSDIKVLSFDNNSFYITQNSTNTDEVIVNFREAAGGGSGEVNTMSNIGAGAGVYYQKTGVDFEMKSLKSQDSTVSVTNDVNEIFFSATGTFYTPVSIEGADPTLTVGSGASTDSILELYDSGALAYTLGLDDSSASFKLASGIFNGTNDIIEVTSGVVSVTGDVRAGRVHAGPSVFYITDNNINNPSIRCPGAYARIVMGQSGDTDNHYSEPQFTFHGQETDGFGYNMSASYPWVGVNGVAKMFWSSSYVQCNDEFRLENAGTKTDPALNFEGDNSTGIYQLVPNTADGTIAFSSVDTYVGHWAGDGLHVNNDIFADDLIVTDTIEAGRVETGIGLFYTQLTLNQQIMKFGPDGILYAWDPTRSKYLSVTRKTFQYGVNSAADLTTDLILSPSGTGVDGGHFIGNVMPRNATITTVVVGARNVNTASLPIQLWTFTLGAAGGTNSGSSWTIPADGNRVFTIDTAANIDIAASTGITMKTAVAGGTKYTIPYAHLEIAWRLD